MTHSHEVGHISGILKGGKGQNVTGGDRFAIQGPIIEQIALIGGCGQGDFLSRTVDTAAADQVDDIPDEKSA